MCLLTSVSRKSVVSSRWYKTTSSNTSGSSRRRCSTRSTRISSRCSFFELCSRYLSSYYTFAIEQNNSAGRSDFEMTGIPGTDYYKDDRLVEFKYFKAKEAERMLALSDPPSRGRGASTRLRQGYQGEVPVLPCPFLHCIYLCQQKDGNAGR